MSDTKSPNNTEKGNVIQVSSQKRPLFFYVRLAKRILQNEETADLSGLGTAINTVVNCAEILKNQGVVEITKIETSTAQVGKGNSSQFNKAKIQISLKKSPKFNEIIAKEQEIEAQRKNARAQKEQQKA